MEKFFKILIIVCAIFIVVNNYQNGIDKNYPIMQLGVTSLWMLVSFILYKSINSKGKLKRKPLNFEKKY